MTDAHPPAPVLSTRDKLLDSAQQLLVQKGFALTSVEEICVAAKATKGAFFHYFKSKEDMALAALDRFASRRLGQMLEGSDRWPSDPVERLFAYVEHVGRDSSARGHSRGCLIAVLALELGATSEVFQRACDHNFQVWAGELKKLIDSARATLDDPDRVSTQELADYFIALFEGSVVLARSSGDPSIVERNLRVFEAHLAAIFPRRTVQQAAG